MRLERVTAGAAERLQARIAGALLKRGLQIGDRVAFLCPNSVELLCGILGAARAGIAPVPLNPALLEFYRVAYCCFRLGQAKLAAEVSRDTSESERLSARAVRYETAIMPLLQDDYCCFTPQESLVD